MRTARIATVLFMCTLAFPCRAEKTYLKGMIVTPDGKPAARAEVHLVSRRWSPEKSDLLASTVADEQGNFVFSEVELPEAKRSTWHVVGWLGGHAIGWAGPDQPNKSAYDDLKITLGKPGAVRGQVRDSTGRTLAGIEVRLSEIIIRSGARGRRWDALYIPQELGQRWATRTDRQGAFTLSKVPALAEPHAVTESPDFGSARFYWQDTGAVLRAVLRRRCSIRGQVQCAEPQIDLSKLKVAYERKSGVTAQEKSDGGFIYYGYMAWQPVPVDEQGRFTFDDLPPGDVRLRLVTTPDSEWQPEGELQTMLREGEKKDAVALVAKPTRGLQVAGRVVDTDTAQPLPNVTLRGTGGSFSSDTELARTDADGRYVFYTRPGQVSLRIFDRPEGYMLGGSDEGFDEGRRVNVGPEPVADVNFSLKKGVRVQVVVEDAKGNPVAGAEVQNSNNRYTWIGLNTLTDKQGTATFQGVNPEKPMTLMARTDTAFSEPLPVNPKALESPVKLVVKEGLGAGVRGRIVDKQGRPLPGLKVMLLAHFQPNQGRSNLSTLVADAGGRVTSGALWPQHGYSLNVSSPGYKTVMTRPWQAARGQVHDFGDIVVVKQDGFLAGRVVDSGGRPVAGAKVWNTGEADDQTTTNPHGRFRLSKLEAGSCYVFAEKAGYRLTGLRRDVPAGDVVLTLRRKTEKSPVVMVARPKPDEAALRRFGLKLLQQGVEAARQKKGGEQEYYRASLEKAMLTRDLARAVEISIRAGGRYNDTVAIEFGKRSLARSVDEAVMHFNQITDLRKRAYTLIDTAQKTAKTDPAKARVLLKYGLTAARGITSIPYQTVMLAQVGGAMEQLKMPQGRQLIRQAAAKAHKFALDGWEAYARGAVAEQMCEFDLEGALALVMPIKDVATEKPRHLGNIAYRIAGRLPERARQLLDIVPQSHYRDHNLARLCYRWAAANPSRAEATAKAIKQDHNKVRAYLWMAERLEKSNRPRAFAFLDQAVAVMLDGAQQDSSFYNARSTAIFIATIAHRAALMGHPGAQDMVLRALSLRWPKRGPMEISSGSGYEGNAKLAVALAGINPGEARRVLETVLPGTFEKSSIPNLYRGDVRLTALATLLLDPAWCERYLERLKQAKVPAPSYVTGDLAAYALGDAKKRNEIIERALDMGGNPDEDD